MNTTEWIQVILTGLNTLVVLVLVGVTWWYAKSTRDMAEEMREARFASARPILVFRPRFKVTKALGSNLLPFEVDVEEYVAKNVVGPVEVVGTSPGGLLAQVHNLGTGPALNIRCYGTNKEHKKITKEMALGPLGAGEYTLWRFSELEEQLPNIAYLEGTCEDVFDRLHPSHPAPLRYDKDKLQRIG